MKVAVAGLGWWGKQIIRSLSASPKFTVVAAVDPFRPADADAFLKEAKVELAPDLAAVGDWDADRVAQVVSNLLSNAVRHGKKGAPIGVSLAADGEDVILTVHNEGAVAPDVLPHIFAPFRSRSDYRARAEGLGLGLFIVERIVHAHGGRVDVVSDEARGTTFRVSLPRHAYAPGEARDTKGETWPKLSVP